MLLDAEDTSLLLIDYQPRLMQAMYDGVAVLGNAIRLARMSQSMGVPAWVTEQSPEKLGATQPELMAWLEPSRVLIKHHFSACADGLLETLRPPQRAAATQGNARSLPRHLQKPVVPATMRNTVVMAGCEAHVCLLQTALDLLEEEFDVWVVTDACASRTERNRDAAFDRLASAGVELVTMEMVAFEWLRSADHPEFKVVQGMIL